jgi:hypothetical protein
MNVYGRLLAHDRKPAPPRTGYVLCRLAPRSWWLRPSNEAIKRQTGPLQRSPVAETDTGGRPAGTIELHIRPRALHPEPAPEPQSP